MELLTHISDVAAGKTTLFNPRSSEWPKVRKEHLRLNPVCAVCEGTEKLQVHHIKSFSTHPELELQPSNLITLCESGGSNHHLLFGHLDNFKRINPEVVSDCANWSNKIKSSKEEPNE